LRRLLRKLADKAVYKFKSPLTYSIELNGKDANKQYEYDVNYEDIAVAYAQDFFYHINDLITELTGDNFIEYINTPGIESISFYTQDGKNLITTVETDHQLSDRDLTKLINEINAQFAAGIGEKIADKKLIEFNDIKEATNANGDIECKTMKHTVFCNLYNDNFSLERIEG
jgi:hypothetical protein